MDNHEREDKMKKAILVALVVLVSASMLFAAGANESSSDKVKLVFVETMTSPQRTLVLQRMIDEYQEMNPNVEIELVSPPYEQADNKVTQMLNSNQAVDIVETRDHTVKQFVNNGNLLDLTPYIEQWDEADDLLDLAWQAANTVDNTPYLIPEFFYIKALVVRTDILEQYGIDIPTTMDELYEACKAITGRTTGQYGYSFRGKSNAFKISDVMLLGDVGNVNPDNIYESMDGKFSLDNEKGREALAKYVDLFRTACPSDSINWGYNEQITGFVSGTTPFLIQDPDVFSSFEGQLDPSQYAAAPVPLGSEGVRYLDYGFSGLSIAADSKHPDEAWDFIAYMLSAEKNAELCKAYGPLPIHQSTYDTDEYFSTGVYTAWAETFADEGTIFVKYPLDSPSYPGWPQVQEQSMQSLLLGNITIDQAIAQWSSYWGY